MNERTMERVASLTGVVFAALVALRTLITPKIPFTYGPDGVGSWFAQNHTIWVTTVWLTGLLIVFGTWYVAGFRAYLARQGASRLGTIALIGWAMLGTIALVRHALLAIPALVPISFELTGFLAAVAGVMLGMVWFCALIVALAIAMAGLESKKLPAWFSWLTMLEAVILLGGTLAMVQANGFFSTSGTFRWVVLWSYVAWNAIGSVLLYSLLKKE